MTTIISIPEGQYHRPAVRYDDGRVEPYAVSSATSGDVLFESPEQAIRYAQNAARSAADTMTVMRYGFGISGIVVLGLGLLDMLGIHPLMPDVPVLGSYVGIYLTLFGGGFCCASALMFYSNRR